MEILRRLFNRKPTQPCTINVSVTGTAEFKALLESTRVLLAAAKFCEVGYGSYTARDARKKAIALLKDAGVEVEESN